MARGKISKRTVETIEPESRDIYLWDNDLAGFGVKVTSKGTRTYLAQYRLGGRRGRTRRVTIGQHGTLTADQARQEAKRILGEVATGHDVAEEKTAARNEGTIAELCDLWLAEGCPNKKASTLVTDRSNIERHIKPLLGRKQLSAVTRTAVERMQRDIAAGKTAADILTKNRGRAIVRGGKGTAARATSILGAILTFAVNRGLRLDNPARGVTLFKGEKKERFLSTIELVRLGEVLAAEENEGGNPYAVLAIRLLLLTGCRKGEILTLKWDWVDFENQCLRLPHSKTGAKVVPLGAPALKLLANAPHIEDCPFVLPSVKGDSHFVGLQKVWEKIRTKAGLEGVRLHDLRHSFASFAVAGGESLFMVGKVLGHTQARATEVYAHLHNDPLRAVADRTANKIEAALMGSRNREGEVVPLPRGK